VAVPRNHVLTTQRQALHVTQEGFCELFGRTAHMLGMNLGVSVRSIARWEAGEILTCPLPDYRRVLEALFNLPIEELGFTLPDPNHNAHANNFTAYGHQLMELDQPWTHDGAIDAIVEVSEKAPLDRRNFTVLSGAALSAPVLAWMCDPQSFQPALNGRRVTMPMVRRIEQGTKFLRDLDSETGSGDLLEMTNTHLRFVTSLLKHGSYTEPVGHTLFSAVAELCRVAGWVCFDSNRHAAAQSYWLAGLRATHTVENRAFGTHIMGYLSEQAFCAGNAQDALQLAQAAQASGKGVTTYRDAAVTGMRLAWAQALSGEKTYANMLNRASALFERGSPADETTHAYWMDEAALACETGRCFLEANQPQQAAELLRQGLSFFSPSYLREHAYWLSVLATAHLRQREVEQACAVASQALNLLTGQVNSPRIVNHLHDFQQELTPYDVPCVREFTERARQLL